MKRFFFFRIVVLFTSLLSFIFIAGCTGQSTSAKETVRIGVVKNMVVSIPFYQIQAGQQLEHEGYQVEWVYFDSPIALAEAFLSGDIQVNSAIGFSTIMDLTDKGADIRIVYVNGYAASAKIYSKNLSSVEQIKGCRLGMPPASTETSRLATILLEEIYSLKPAKDYKPLNTTSVAGVTLLQKGDIEALLSYGTEAANLQQNGYHPIFDLSESWKTYSNGNNLMTSATVVTEQFAGSHTEFIKAFKTAYDHAVQELLNNPDIIEQIASSKYQLKKESIPYFNQLALTQLKGAGASPEAFSEAKKLLDFFSGDKQNNKSNDALFFAESQVN